MSQHYELYRYAAPGARILKQLQTGTRQHQARYLAGLEIRTGSAQQSLLGIALARCRVWRKGSLNVTHFNLNDRLDSICGAVDGRGKLVSRESWYPYGGTACWLTAAQAGATIKFQRYGGKERDVTGLIFYGWRSYMPWQMRWLNSDPAGTVDGLNLFRMVGNNPVTLNDHDGRMPDALFSMMDEDLDDLLVETDTKPTLNTIAGQPECDLIEPTSCPPPLANDDREGLPREIPALPAAEPPSPQQVPVVNVTSYIRDVSFAVGPSVDTSATNNYRCKFCPRGFSSIKGLNRHLKQGHPKDILRCPIKGCTQICYEKEFLDMHVKFHAVELFKCNDPLCGDFIKGFANYYQHQQSHNVKPIYHCAIQGCTAVFYSEAECIAHRATHVETTIICQFCNRSFSTHGGLQYHLNKMH